MASLTLTRESVGVLNDLATVLARDSVDLWRLATSGDAVRAGNVLAEHAPSLTATYGEVAADLGTTLYDETRASAGVSGRFRAAPAGVVPESQSTAMARWSVGPMFGANPDDALALAQFVSGIDRLVRLPYRRTLLENTGADDGATGAVRVAQPGACSFCMMLASRGVEHVSLHGDTTQDRWHRNCKCAPVPSFGPGFDDMPDQADIYREWLKVTAGAGSTTDQMNAWRRHVATPTSS